MKLKPLILLITTLTISVISFGQNDYIAYNLKVFQARKLNYDNKLDSAVLLYQQAFNLVDYVHIENLISARKLAEKVKDNSLLVFCKKRIEEYSIGNNFNTKYSSTIDSLSEEDQRVRRDNSYAKYLYDEYIKDTTLNRQTSEFLDARKLMLEWWQVDSTNVYKLLSLIKENGFPSEKIVGKKTYKRAFIILLHFDKDNNNQTLKPIIDKALIEGDLRPSHYAWIFDRRLSWVQGKDAYYHQLPGGPGNINEKEIIEINSRRKEIGLRKLFEGIEITKDDMSISVKNLY